MVQESKQLKNPKLLYSATGQKCHFRPPCLFVWTKKAATSEKWWKMFCFAAEGCLMFVAALKKTPSKLRYLVFYKTGALKVSKMWTPKIRWEAEIGFMLAVRWIFMAVRKVTVALQSSEVMSVSTKLACYITNHYLWYEPGGFRVIPCVKESCHDRFFLHANKPCMDFPQEQ